MKSHKTSRAKKPPLRAKTTSGFGQAVLTSLRGWERGEPLTVRQVPIIHSPRSRRRADVKKLRVETLGVSQAVFARLIGVSPKLVEAWESGRNIPSRPVCRLFEIIERDPQEFLRRFARGSSRHRSTQTGGGSISSSGRAPASFRPDPSSRLIARIVMS